MKLFAIAAVAISLVQQARSAPSTPSLEVRAPEVCGFPTIPLLQAVSDSRTDRLYTTDTTEVEAALDSGIYVRSALLAYVYSNATGTSVPNAVPLYRIYNAAGTDHYVTTSWAEVESAVNDNGYEYQGAIGYVYDQAQSDCAGTVPFYRAYYFQNPEHYYTTVLAAKNSVVTNSGYTYEGIAAYVFPPS